MTLEKNLKELRLTYGVTQEEVATALGIGRSSIVAIEQGKRSLTSEELGKLADYLGIELYDLLSQETPDYEKYREMLAEVIRCAGANSDGGIPKTKLAKLIYLADFAWFYEHLLPMSGMKYRRLEYGPVPDQFFRVVDEMIDEGKLNLKVKDQDNSQIISLTRAGEASTAQHLRRREQELIKDICRKWKDKNTQEIVAFTHTQIPWQICRPNEFIPYELITQEEPSNVY